MKKHVLLILSVIMALFLTSCTRETLTVDHESLTLYVGAEESLTPSGEEVISWASSATDIATVSMGLVTGIAPGRATITVQGTHHTVEVAITVLPLPTRLVLTLSEETLSLVPADTAVLLAEVTRITGDVSTKLAVTMQEITWTSDDERTVTVSGGILRAIDVGSATITAMYQEAVATCRVTVTTGKRHVITLSPDEATLMAGEELSLSWSIWCHEDGIATKLDLPASALDFKSNNEMVATVADGVIHAHERGSTTIFLIYQEATASVQVTVLDPLTVEIETRVLGDYGEIKEAVLNANTTALETDDVSFIVRFGARCAGSTVSQVLISFAEFSPSAIVSVVDGITTSEDVTTWEGTRLCTLSTTGDTVYGFFGSLSSANRPTMSLSGDADFISKDGTFPTTRVSVTVERDEEAHARLNGFTNPTNVDKTLASLASERASADEALATGTNVLSFLVPFYDVVSSLLPTLAEAITLQTVLESALPLSTDETVIVTWKDAYLDAVSWFGETLVKVNESSFRGSVFYGMTELEITELLERTRPLTAEEKSATAAQDEILSSYNALADPATASTTSDLYVSYVEASNALATLEGDADYLTYAYRELHSRSYLPASVSIFNGLVASTIVPLLKMLSDAEPIKERVYGDEGLAQAAYLLNGTIAEAGASDVLSDFYESLGGDASVQMNRFFTSRAVYGGSLDQSRGVAYTTSLLASDAYITYYGPGNQDYSSIVHESGHYYAAVTNDGMTEDTDLAELQSQGASALALAYLELHPWSGLNELALREYVNRSLYEDLATILMATIVNDFETCVYTGSYTAGETMDEVMTAVCEDYGGIATLSSLGLDPLAYWKTVAFTNPGYYVSYAVSGVVALELYAQAFSSYEAAVTTYLAIASAGVTASFLATVDASGLASPFSAESFLIMTSTVIDALSRGQDS